MDTNLQPKKKSSPKNNSRKNAEIVLSVTKNQWWPFDRVDGKLLNNNNKDQQRAQEEPAPF